MFACDGTFAASSHWHSHEMSANGDRKKCGEFDVPTYQYACTACDHRFETVQAFTDAALTDCPECAGRLRKLYGSVGVVFKGSGFYRNDSRSGSSSTVPADSSSSSTTSSGDSSSTSSSSGSGDSKSSSSSTGSSGSSSSGSSSTGTKSTAAAS